MREIVLSLLLAISNGAAATASLAQTVGPSGKVYAVETAEIVKGHPKILDAESSILANKSDDHTKNVFDPAVRGHTDQFLYRFMKPK
jgi:predicted methyltransferase